MKIFAICDTELNYARRLAERMSAESEVFSQVQVFDSVKAISEYLKKNKLELLLLTEELFKEYEEALLQGAIDRVFLLSSENVGNSVNKSYKSFFKYQAASMLIKELEQAYRQAEGSKGRFAVATQEKTVVIGVFSPSHCVEKTVWALLLGLILAKDRAVLYLNMERYAGFDAVFNKIHTTDLSESFYHIMHGKEEDLAKAEDFFESYRGLSYIAPIRFAREFDGLEEATVLQCIKRIVELSNKGRISEKIVILDFSGSTCGHWELLKLCDKIFLIQRSDCMTEASVAAFQEECRLTMGEVLEKKLERVKVSALEDRINERFLELNEEGELGKAIKNILQREMWFDGGAEKGTNSKTWG